MAIYNRELIEPLVAALERSTTRVAELERENGRLEAENRVLVARTEAQSVEPTPEPPLIFLRRRWVWIAVLVAFVVIMAALPAWPG